jgi:tetratricopeptide (TPR) repeat protein
MDRPDPAKDQDTLPFTPAGGSGGGDAAAVAGGTYGRFVAVGLLGSGGMGVVLSAYDPKLDRKVAIKLLRPDLWGSESGEVGRARLHREAQAMAKLQHPNVVTVYEAGQAGDREFLAMELVEGQTLRAWQTQKRPWHEVLAMYVAAGQGLEAAHAAGLVHRDFKPENVLIGRDGRPRVGDFGLVGSGVRADTADLGNATIETGLTVGGSVIGTPAYMAPEQWTGAEEIDARADQFAFCVALWEAIYGEAPFGRADVTERRRAVLEGDVKPPPAARGVPAWLEAALRRGLAREPSARWPSMTDLLAELSRGPARRRRLRVILAVTAGALLAAGSLAIVFSMSAKTDPCPSADARLAGVWDEARRAQVRAAFEKTGLPFAARTASLVEAAMDADRKRWLDMHQQACVATRVEGRQSDSMLDRRMECLDRWRSAAEALTSLWIGEGDTSAVEGAVSAVGALPSIEDCEDLKGLAERTPLPRDPEARRKVDEAAAALDRANALSGARRIQEARIAAEAALASADASGHDPLRARARSLLAFALWKADVSDAKRAHDLAQEAARIAAEVHDDALATEAMTLLSMILSETEGKYVEALAVADSAEVMLRRAGNPRAARVNLLTRRAFALQRLQRYDESRQLLDEAARLVGEGGENLPIQQIDLVIQRALLASESGDLVTSRKILEEIGVPLVERVDSPTDRTGRAVRMVDDAFDTYVAEDPIAYRTVPATKKNLAKGNLVAVRAYPQKAPKSEDDAMGSWRIGFVQSIDWGAGKLRLVGREDPFWLSATRVIVISWKKGGKLEIVGKRKREELAVGVNDVILPTSDAGTVADPWSVVGKDGMPISTNDTNKLESSSAVPCDSAHDHCLRPWVWFTADGLEHVPVMFKDGKLHYVLDVDDLRAVERSQIAYRTVPATVDNLKEGSLVYFRYDRISSETDAFGEWMSGKVTEIQPEAGIFLVEGDKRYYKIENARIAVVQWFPGEKAEAVP